MTITTPETPVRTRLLEVAAGTWRALDAGGRALGHVRLVTTAEGDRYRALRFHAATRSFRTVGEFWSSVDAVDSLRYGR